MPLWFAPPQRGQEMRWGTGAAWGAIPTTGEATIPGPGFAGPGPGTAGIPTSTAGRGAAGGGAGPGGGWGCAAGAGGAAAPNAPPQLAQKRPVAGFSFPHEGHGTPFAWGPKSKFGAAGREAPAWGAGGAEYPPFTVPASGTPRGGVGSTSLVGSRFPQSWQKRSWSGLSDPQRSHFGTSARGTLRRASSQVRCWVTSATAACETRRSPPAPPHEPRRTRQIGRRAPVQLRRSTFGARTAGTPGRYRRLFPG
jgi:hypothetical protein